MFAPRRAPPAYAWRGRWRQRGTCQRCPDGSAGRVPPPAHAPARTPGTSCQLTSAARLRSCPDTVVSATALAPSALLHPLPIAITSVVKQKCGATSARRTQVSASGTWRLKVIGFWPSACGLPTLVKMISRPALRRFSAARYSSPRTAYWHRRKSSFSRSAPQQASDDGSNHSTVQEHKTYMCKVLFGWLAKCVSGRWRRHSTWNDSMCSMPGA